jgi:hypothetical protein
MVIHCVILYTDKSTDWVSVLVIVAFRQTHQFSAMSWREQVNFQWDDDEVCFVLDQQSEDIHVAPLGHIILIPSQRIFALLP